MGKAKYPKYKPSKTLWQEQIPNHWQETELRMLFADNKIKNVGLVEKNLLSLSYGKLKRKDIDNATGLVPASFEGYQIIEEGYIVLRFTDLQNDKKSLRVGYNNEKGIITNAYIGLAPKADIHSKYFYYQLHFLDKIKYFYNLGGGVRQSLAFKEFGRETVLIPDKEEQQRIANFLDYKLAKIERFIRKKKELIKRFVELKEAILNKTITKGLTPNIEMKPVDIYWVNSIPKHYKLEGFNKNVFLKHGFQFREHHFATNGVKIVKISQLSPKGFLDLNNASLVPNEIASQFENIKISDGNVLMALTGGTIGKIIRANTNNELLLQNYRVGNFIPNNDNLTLDYLYWQLKSYFIQAQMKFYVRETGQPNIGKGDFRKILMIVPPKNEQIELVKHISSETNRLDLLISKIEREIEIVEEYKTSIIAESVTGKIDVRNYQFLAIEEEETFEELEEELNIAAEGETNYETENQ